MRRPSVTPVATPCLFVSAPSYGETLARRKMGERRGGEGKERDGRGGGEGERWERGEEKERDDREGRRRKRKKEEEQEGEGGIYVCIHFGEYILGGMGEYLGQGPNFISDNINI